MKIMDMLFSLGLDPLIGNIFTNELDNNTNSGILISDITDHLPIFALCQYIDIKRNCRHIYTAIRKTDANCIAALKK